MAPKRIPLHEAAPTHDEYFQENFADPVAAAGLVRLVAPPALIVDLNKIADDTIETIEGLDAHTRATLLAMKHIFENDPDILVFLGKLSVRIQAMPREQQKRFLERTILYLNYSGSVKSQDARILLENYPEDEDPMRFKTGYQKDMEESFQLGEAKGIEQGIEQGIERGLTLEKIEVIQNLLAKGLDWNFIQSVTHIDQAGFEALFQKHAK